MRNNLYTHSSRYLEFSSCRPILLGRNKKLHTKFWPEKFSSGGQFGELKILKRQGTKGHNTLK